MRITYLLLLFVLLFQPLGTRAQKTDRKTFDVSISVTDKESREPIIMATVQLQPAGILAVTDADGHAVLRNIEAGHYTLLVSYVGYEPMTTQVVVNKPLTMSFSLTSTTLALQEVNVVAKQNASGASTSSIIGRQAIDHLQASSLADVIQLLPGQLGVGDIISITNIMAGDVAGQ